MSGTEFASSFCGRSAVPASVVVAGAFDAPSPYQRIREWIVLGQLAPGSRVTEEELAGQLGLSRTPVREALGRLLRDGYVVNSAGARSAKARLFVAPLTQANARELHQILGQLEALAAERAAKLPQPRRLAVVAELRRINEQQGDNERGVIEVDLAFHQTLLEAGAGHRLRAIGEAIKPQVERYRRLYASSTMDDREPSVREHGRIIAAMEGGDAAAAEASMRENWRNGGERLVQAILRRGELGLGANA